MKRRRAAGKIKPPVQTEEMKAKASARMIGNENSKGGSGGFCKWYEIDNNGSQEKVQGTWELAYANYLIGAGIEFESHPKFLRYTDYKGKARRYFPDFKIRDGPYVDVKNPFCLKQDAQKIKSILDAGIELQIVTKADLEAIGVSVK